MENPQTGKRPARKEGSDEAQTLTVPHCHNHTQCFVCEQHGGLAKLKVVGEENAALWSGESGVLILPDWRVCAEHRGPNPFLNSNGTQVSLAPTQFRTPTGGGRSQGRTPMSPPKKRKKHNNDHTRQQPLVALPPNPATRWCQSMMSVLGRTLEENRELQRREEWSREHPCAVGVSVLF